MPRQTKQLSATEVKNAKAKEKEYYLVDGQGLKLRVLPSGSKQWLFNYYRPTNGKRANLNLGRFPDVSLVQARKASLNAKELIAQGIDPQDERKRQQQAHKEIHEHTFVNVAKDWFAIKQHDVTPDYALDIWRSLELHIFPHISDKPVKAITAPEIIELLKPIEAKGSLETVKRLTQQLNEVMNFATNCGLIQANPLTGIKAAFKKPKKENMAALTPAELPELMGAIANASIKRTTRCLLEWQLHTMTRPAEASGARWDEIDWEEKVWTIPAERMKKRREHRIPLTEQMLALLEVMKPKSGHRDFIFPSDRDPKKPCNSQTANMALKRMGFAGRLVSHGLRSLASTTLNEQGFDPDLVEAALAHVDDNQVRSAYNRTDYLERRKPMMCWWSGHIEEAAKGSLSVTGTKQLRII
ncbi:tyrosine-type recombinase/integrase [Vibrio parahaemolyticus]|uniref:integrase domain-containing protein n=1 Tax=Vibrio parahaemolyticus TaxID=670 RepID=UPI0006B2831F|nr:integrase domain-containing protein [Vibrio parahaemolyticus]EHH2507624.1 tyrosine-type recombinase/integrase [Vibrio parahaemolyticus]EIZ1330477.1 tyrosine-type recombinase/integrase [Vibrio parahaemolyticus]EJB5625799.1 tyrosine-type recombinase/integrase [Vibrio parahaemolyticus]EJB5626803.1 tyrosine-type recombinase/integrase [Vibrio parahaemolyticus]EJG0981286.1 tyrosine-type recombinase/integrase [Vibrio parahaemolyticus]